MIILLFVGSTWFAKTRLEGHPELQQALVKLAVYAGLLSDAKLHDEDTVQGVR